MTPESSAQSTPTSPHTVHRGTIRSLTLPTNPNLDIPQSPPGSPTPGADQRFSHFLELKKHDIHFNTKLASSSALKNPSLLPKLMESAGVGKDWQYTATLSTELWDPLGFPPWAYKEELAEAQRSLSKKREGLVMVQRESIDFVAAGTPEQSSRSVIPMGSGASATERLMAGLGNNVKSSPQPSIVGVRIETEKRGRTRDGLHGGGRSQSPNKRKRSRSR